MSRNIEISDETFISWSYELRLHSLYPIDNLSTAYCSFMSSFVNITMIMVIRSLERIFNTSRYTGIWVASTKFKQL